MGLQRASELDSFVLLGPRGHLLFSCVPEDVVCLLEVLVANREEDGKCWSMLLETTELHAGHCQKPGPPAQGVLAAQEGSFQHRVGAVT